MKLTVLSRPLLAAVLSCAALAAAPSHADDGISHAQPMLPTQPLEIDTHKGAFKFRVEIADTDATQQVGLMYRPTLANDAGMLFEFSTPQEAHFWMEHCAHPLDMVFIDQAGHIHSIARNTKPFSLDPVDSNGDITSVLELRGGRAAEIGAGPGDVVKTAFYRNG
ncbi:MAG TPA: DUF192 domain-containing protein [Caulobacteraceae bacterium]